MKKIFIIIVSLLVLLLIVSFQMQPVIEKMAIKKMDQFVQLVINHVSFTEEIDDQQLFTDTDHTIEFNMVYINKICSQYVSDLENVLQLIQEGKYKKKNQSIYNQYLKEISDNQGIIASIPIGGLTGNVFLENIGPRLHVRYQTQSLVSSNISKTVKSYGINHVLVTIDLTVLIELQILIPFRASNYKKSFQIPLVFKILEGEVPSWYQGQS
ncbi:hypothetical protein H6A03_11430 [[Clostridium] spiroforme]|nr:hypothetical protein [Thomasclavelia spiroformis]MBM6881184.1 hypothetical protein [Thomasclavelia spiroformis]